MTALELLSDAKLKHEIRKLSVVPPRGGDVDRLLEMKAEQQRRAAKRREDGKVGA